MLTTSRNPGVLHTGYYTYKPSHGVLGFMMSCAASVLLLRVLLRLFKEDEISEENLQTAAGMALAGCLLFYLGTTWFFSFITGYSRKLTISEEGIRYGPAYFSWPQVKALRARLKRGGYQVRVVLKRSWFPRRRLVTDDGMTREQYEDFLRDLQDSIQPRFPGLLLDELPAVATNVAASPVEVTDAGHVA